MKTIILNHYYPHLTERVMLEVSDKIAVTLSPLAAVCATATSAANGSMTSVPWTAPPALRRA